MLRKSDHLTWVGPLQGCDLMMRAIGNERGDRDATGSSWVRPIDFNVINPELSMLCSCGARQATCHASSGSSWTSREARVQRGWPDVGPPQNIVRLLSMDTPPPREWEAQLSVQPRTSGEQAGLYAYADERSWVKLVIEGQADGGVSLVFASQHAAVPFVAGKLPLPDYRGSCWLRLTADDAGGVVASYRLTGGSWAMVPRGLGWLNAHENAHELEHARAEQAVAEDATNGRLELGDPRGGLRAFCRLPVETDWTAALVTEQFGVPCPVHFAHLAVTGATPRPRDLRRAKRDALRNDYSTLDV